MRRTLLTVLLISSLHAQSDWPSFGGDLGAARFSPLDQINAANVDRLRRAWTFHTGQPGSEGIPIVADGVMYLVGANGLFAVEPETGKQIWHYQATGVALRGLAYWPGRGTTHARVFAGVSGGMVALDATTGKPAPGFADEGLLDLKQGVLGDLPDAKISLQSPPVVVGNLIITGSANGENTPSLGAYGDIRAWDADSGKLVWTFHTVPRPGEPGHETWPGDSWKNRTGVNNWGFMTIDEQRGIVYIPLGSPTSDFYGADRPGNGLYGNSLVALDIKTGKLLWHQQLVHHDLWDFDPAAAPILFDAELDGDVVPAVAQITKPGLLFTFHRVTGAPVYGMDERPVPQTTVPGEWTSPTQPFPRNPPPLSRVSFSEDDLYNLTPEHAAFCRDLYERNKMKPVELYTPFPMEQNVLMFPSTLGGGGWGGLSWDPSLGLLFTNVNNLGQWGHMEKRAEGEPGTPYFRTSEYGSYARFWNVETKIPCTNPPFGELVAIDTRTGSITWRSTLGTTPALEALGVRNTGAPSLGGSIATAGGLVFIAATNDARFRAFESTTGKLLWDQPIDANGHTIPITYLGKDGKQYVTLMAGNGGGYFGGASSDSLIAFALGDGAVPQPSVTQAPAPADAAPIVLPDVPARAILTRSCGGACHGLESVTVSRRDRAGWSAMIDTMVSRGAVLSAADRQVILDYLTEYAGN